MRILVATYYYLPHVGGGTWYLHHLAIRLARAGHQVLLLAPRIDLALTVPSFHAKSEAGLEVQRLNGLVLPRWLGPAAALLLFRPRYLRAASHSDVLVGQFNPHHPIAFSTVLLGKITRKPVVLRVEDWRRWMFGSSPDLFTRAYWQFTRPLNALNEWAARQAEVLLVVDVQAAAHFQGLRAPPRNVRVSPNGVDLEEIQALPPREELRRQLGLPSDAPIVVYIGRFGGAEYRVEILLEAFEGLVHVMPDALLVLVGDDLPKGLRLRFAPLLQDGAVRVVGAVPPHTALAYTAAANVTIGPLGPTHTLPLKVVEAFAAGVPIIVGRGTLAGDGGAPGTEVRLVDSTSDSVRAALVDSLDRASHSRAPPRDSLSPYGWNTIASHVELELRKIAHSEGQEASGA